MAEEAQGREEAGRRLWDKIAEGSGSPTENRWGEMEKESVRRSGGIKE